MVNALMKRPKNSIPHVLVSEDLFSWMKIGFYSLIVALATTMKNCVQGLKTIPELHARYYCGYRLMQNCARHIGLDRFPYKIEYQRPDHDY